MRVSCKDLKNIGLPIHAHPTYLGRLDTIRAWLALPRTKELVGEAVYKRLLEDLGTLKMLYDRAIAPYGMLYTLRQKARDRQNEACTLIAPADYERELENLYKREEHMVFLHNSIADIYNLHASQQDPKFGKLDKLEVTSRDVAQAQLAEKKANFIPPVAASAASAAAASAAADTTGELVGRILSGGTSA